MAKVECSRCGYCMPCPAELRIPELLDVYNLLEESRQAEAQRLYEQQENKADACIRCGRCEKSCPQHIVISVLLFDLGEEFE